VWAASAPVLQGKRMAAVLTVPSPLVRAPASLQHQLVTQVRGAARAVSDGLRAARR
jgi:DNA-binding IclR family transcriptional regulator